MAGSPFLEELRRATAAAHHALDARAGMDGQVTRERYVAFLRGSLAALELVEPSVVNFGGKSDAPSRAECLRADLRALGAAPNSLANHADTVPELATEAGTIGATYVVEGSSLGGMVMARSVDAALRLEGHAQTYLRFRGERTGEAWRRCVSELSAWASEPPLDNARRPAPLLARYSRCTNDRSTPQEP